VKSNTPFYSISGGGSEAIFGAMTEMLLKVRVELRLETASDQNDEDVTTYLAGLLVSYIDPAYLDAISRVVAPYEIDVYDAVNRSTLRYQIYWIYKVNADDGLLALSIFSTSNSESASARLETVRRYYHFASEYHRQLSRKSTAVGAIQTKLANSTERYLQILNHARTEYMHLIEQLGAEELSRFHAKLSQFEQELPLRTKQDELLDAYLAWRKTPEDPNARKRFDLLAEELQQLDPQFTPEFIIGKP